MGVALESECPEAYFRRNVFYTFIDHTVTQLEERFPNSSEGMFLGFSLLPNFVLDLTTDDKEAITRFFSPDLPKPETFDTEILIWKSECSEVPRAERLNATLLDTLQLADKDFYPNVHAILKLLLTLPWYHLFQTYLLAAGIDALSGIRKKALLEHCLGTEGQRILATLPTAVSEQQLVEAGGQQPQEDAEELLYRNVVNALDAHFGSHVTVVTERHRFRPRSQAQSETIRQFIAALRQLATRCKFGKLHDQMVRDQLIERTAVPAIRECLLLEKDVLRCVQAVEIAGQVEVAKHEALQLGETASDQTPTASAQMQATDIQRVHRKPKSAPRSTRAGTKAPKQTTKQTEFFGNCGLSGHKVGNQSCPPIDLLAVHLAVHRQRQVKPECVPWSTRSLLVRVQDLSCALTVANHSLKILIDLGAKVSVLNQPTWQRCFSAYSRSATTQLIGYDGKSIKALGKVSLPVQYDHQPSTTLKFFVTSKDSNLMGVDLFDHLGFNIAPPPLSPVFALSLQQAVHRWPSLFTKKLASITGYAHEPQRMVSQGIIEPTDSSPWLSNLVVVRKKSGGLRLCVDLRAVNKAIIPDKYPLPTVVEIASQFQGSTTFSKLDLSQGYLQIPLTKSSKKLTVFITHEGICQFTRMPFRLSSAPSAFQKIMSSLLSGLAGVAVYMDDIVLSARFFFQEIDGCDKPVAYASRALNETEQKCSFILRTDHQALTTLLSASGTGRRPFRLHRWADRLFQYNFDTVYRPGNQNQVADCLSRTTNLSPSSSPSEKPVQLLTTPFDRVITLEELQKASASDPLLLQVCDYIVNGWPGKLHDPLFESFSRIRDELTVWNDSCVARGDRAVIP
ncbi:uncharacterized protein LOC134189228 [Corticium candelabrum]|uniref:uncharacterized protein LOC134189228 n=1 Tax=Corticium candelabrum TaxID=121492 RepID=UPI002E2671B7|nr:uncharacterized protein LOC134189228 [Corticium candelabrum]